MVKKRYSLGISVIILVLVIMVVGCASYTPQRYSPLTSMTVVLVQRYPAQNAVDAKAVMEIYIDGKLEGTVEDNRYAIIPVNDGVHNILVKVGDLESERLNFTAYQRTVPFLASIETEIKGTLFKIRGKTIVKLERSTIQDDTGVLTGRESIEIFTPQQ